MLCFFTLYSAFTAAQQCQQIQINGGASWFPFFYQANHQKYGIIGDIVIEASKRQGIRPIIIDPTPWKRTLLMLKHGNIDVVAGAIKTKERADEFEFSDTLITTQLKIIVRIGEEFTFNSIEDLKNREGLKIRGHSLGSKNDDFAQSNLIIKEVHDISSILKMLSAHRADYGVYEVQGARHNINHLKLNDQLTLLKHPLSDEPLFVIFSKNSNCSHAASNYFRTFNDMKTDGSIQRIQAQYLQLTSHAAGIEND